MATSRKREKSSKAKSKFRASWKGQLRFGLVAFSVQAVNAEIKEQGEIHFHLLHAPDHQRIHFAKMCPKHGEVPQSEIVEGYECGKGRYVEIEKDELDSLRTDREKALTVDTFIATDDVDPLYFDGRMYYLIPDGRDAQEPYTVLEEAMKKQKRWGIGQVVFSGREQLAIVRPFEGLLTMAMLNYNAEIRKPEEFESEIVRPRTTPRKVKLAEDLIRNRTEKDFDFSDYEDKYRHKVKSLVDAKVQGKKIVAPDEDEEPQVVNLMDALKRSISQTSGGSHRTNGRSASSKGKRATKLRRA
jgi:DNA end-binding protein Ku